MAKRRVEADAHDQLQHAGADGVRGVVDEVPPRLGARLGGIPGRLESAPGPQRLQGVHLHPDEGAEVGEAPVAPALDGRDVVPVLRSVGLRLEGGTWHHPHRNVGVELGQEPDGQRHRLVRLGGRRLAALDAHLVAPRERECQGGLEIERPAGGRRDGEGEQRGRYEQRATPEAKVLAEPPGSTHKDPGTQGK